MDILSYLTILIKTHKEVGIPGLGTIYKKKSPGRYDVDTHSFLPPTHLLNFTSDLKEQTLLAELISKQRNISTDAAIYFIEQFSQNVLDELSKHQQSVFGDLGTFSTASGSLTFVPNKSNSFGFDFYGLPTLKADTNVNQEHVETPAQETPSTESEQQVAPEQLDLENNNADLGDGTVETTEEAQHVDEALISHIDSTETPVQTADNNNDDQPVYEEISEVIIPEPVKEQEVVIPHTPVISQPAHFNLEEPEIEKSGMPGYVKVIIGLAAILIMAVIVFILKPELFNGGKVKNTPILIAPKTDTVQIIKDTERIKMDSIAHADSVRISNEKAILAIDSAKKSTIAVPVEQAIAQPVISYDIIAASLLNKEEADKFLDDMRKRGIPAKIAVMPGRRVKISIGSFTDEETAKNELEILKKTTKIPGIYIARIRHTNNPK